MDQGDRRGGRGGGGRVVKYMYTAYYILTCTGSMFESVDF